MRRGWFYFVQPLDKLGEEVLGARLEICNELEDELLCSPNKVACGIKTLPHLCANERYKCAFCS